MNSQQAETKSLFRALKGGCLEAMAGRGRDRTIALYAALLDRDWRSANSIWQDIGEIPEAGAETQELILSVAAYGLVVLAGDIPEWSAPQQ